MIFKDKSKATDMAVWKSFEKPFTVIAEERSFKVVECTSEDAELPSTYANISYADLETIWRDPKPLEHWRWIRDMVIEADHKLLLFILEYEISLQRIVRTELAYRQKDQNNRKITNEEAQKLWLR